MDINSVSLRYPNLNSPKLHRLLRLITPRGSNDAQWEISSKLVPQIWPTMPKLFSTKPANVFEL